MEKEIRVLILEDNPSDMELIKYHLKKNKLNLSVIETKKKTEFITAIENNLPDLVLSDFSLPDIDGEEALKLIREKDQDIPFILVSANIGEEKAVELMRKGANDFVMKDKLARLSPAIIRELQEYDNRIQAKIDHQELLKSKKEITSQKDFYGSILENITNGVWVTDKDDIIKYTNEEMTRIAGVPKNKIVGNSVIDGFSKETISEFKKRYLKVKDSLFQSQYEALVVTPAGKNQIQRGWLIPYVKDKKFDGMICTAEDVTEKVNTQNKLDEQKRQLNTLVSNLPGMAYRCIDDDDWTMIFMSDHCKELTGYDPQNIINNNIISYKDIIYENDREYVSGEIHKQNEETNFFELEYRILTSSGEIKWVWEKGQSFYDKISNQQTLEGLIIDITEKKEAEKKIIESQEKLLRGEKIAKFGYWQIDLNDNSVELSEGAIAIFELEGVFYDLPMIRKLAVEEYRIPNRIAYNELVKDNIPYKVEYQARGLRTQQLKYIRSIAEIDKEGKKIFGVIHDITEHKILELDLIESQRKFYSLYNNAPDMYASVDAETALITECNDTLLRITGYNRDDVMGKNIFDIYHKDSIADAKKAREEFLKLGRVKNKRLILKKKDGEKLFVNLNIEAVKDESGKIIYSISSWRDISDLIEFDNALKESEEKFRSMILASPMGILHYNKDGTVTDFNDSLLKVFDSDSEKLQKFNLIRDLKDRTMVAEVKKAVDPDFGSGFFEDKYISALTGKKLYIRAIFQGIRDKSGEINSALGIYEDITEKKEHEEMLLRQKHDLERSNKELEEFAYVASHDLQEPLRMIASFTQLLVEKYSSDLNDEAKSYMNFAVEGAKRMQNLILGLLDYSRVTTKGSSMKIIKLDSALNIARTNLQMLIDESGVEIISEKLPEVMADETQLTIVFQNLIQNAIKFRDPDKKIKIQISSKFLVDEDKWEITVEDNGIGINKKHLDKIFTIFHRLHNQQTYPGTGIGLSICKRIVQRHCGTIRAESDGKGKGTKMIFTIPSQVSNNCK